MSGGRHSLPAGKLTQLIQQLRDPDRSCYSVAKVRGRFGGSVSATSITNWIMTSQANTYAGFMGLE